MKRGSCDDITDGSVVAAKREMVNGGSKPVAWGPGAVRGSVGLPTGFAFLASDHEAISSYGFKHPVCGTFLHRLSAGMWEPPSVLPPRLRSAFPSEIVSNGVQRGMFTFRIKGANHHLVIE